MCGGNQSFFLISALSCTLLFPTSQNEVQPLFLALQRSQQVAASSADGASPRKATVVSPGPPPSLKGVVAHRVPLGSCLRLPFLTSEEAQEELQEIGCLGPCIWLESHDSNLGVPYQISETWWPLLSLGLMSTRWPESWAM